MEKKIGYIFPVVREFSLIKNRKTYALTYRGYYHGWLGNRPLFVIQHVYDGKYNTEAVVLKFILTLILKKRS